MQTSSKKLTTNLLRARKWWSNSCLNDLQASVNINNSAGFDGDRSYVSLRKDLGGQNLSFYPRGYVPSIQFLQKPSWLFEEAGVPESARVHLAVNCVKSSPGKCAAYKEITFQNLRHSRKHFDHNIGVSNKSRNYLLNMVGTVLAIVLIISIRRSKFFLESIQEKNLVQTLCAGF